MRAVYAYSLAIDQAANIFPNHFIVAKRWPSVILGLVQKLFERAAARSDEQRLARHRVVVRGLGFLVHLAQVRVLAGFKVPAIFSVMPVVTTYP